MNARAASRLKRMWVTSTSMRLGSTYQDMNISKTFREWQEVVEALTISNSSRRFATIGTRISSSAPSSFRRVVTQPLSTSKLSLEVATLMVAYSEGQSAAAERAMLSGLVKRAKEGKEERRREKRSRKTRRGERRGGWAWG